MKKEDKSDVMGWLLGGPMIGIGAYGLIEYGFTLAHWPGQVKTYLGYAILWGIVGGVLSAGYSFLTKRPLSDRIAEAHSEWREWIVYAVYVVWIGWFVESGASRNLSSTESCAVILGSMIVTIIIAFVLNKYWATNHKTKRDGEAITKLSHHDKKGIVNIKEEDFKHF